TSSDSGSLVIDVITSGGKTDPPLWQRIFWALTEGVVAAVLLMAGGLTALQTASIAGALPFSAAMLLICYGLWRGMGMEHLRTISHVKMPTPILGTEPVPWQKRLRSLISHPKREKVRHYLKTTGWEALRDVAEELRRHEVDARLEKDDEERITLSVLYN